MPVTTRPSLLAFECRPGPVEKALSPVEKPFRLHPGHIHWRLQRLGLLGAQFERLLATPAVPGAIAHSCNEVVSKSAATDSVRREASFQDIQENLLDYL